MSWNKIRKHFLEEANKIADDVKRLKDEGKSVNETAQLLGVRKYSVMVARELINPIPFVIRRVTHRRPKRALTLEQVHEAHKLYISGTPWKTLEERYGRDKRSIYERFKKLDLSTIRPLEVQQRGERDEKILSLRDKGWYLKEIAAKVGLSHTQVWRILRFYNRED